MKKLTYILLALALVVTGFTSCDVTREPKGTPLQKPFSTLADAKMNRDAVYALLRNVESPNNLNSIEYMGDLYHLTFLDNNSLSGLYNWQQNRVLNDELVNAYYANFYNTLVQANYFMFRAEELKNNEEFKKNAEEVKLIDQYIGELKVVRALAHWRLVLRFSKPWDGSTDNAEQSGIITMLSYDPMLTSKAPKSSRAEVYNIILKDLDEAIATIPAEANKDVKPAIYITRDYAYAMKARACLTKEDWQGAFDAASQVVNNYPLTAMGTDRAANIAALERIWKTEDSPEILVRLNANAQFGGVAASVFGGSLENFFVSEDPTDIAQELVVMRLPSVLLEQWVVDLYDEADLRKAVYIGERDFYFEGTGGKYHAPTKFEGNPVLNKDPKRPDFKVGVHLFNAAEAYLIQAEAACELGNAAEGLKTLEKIQTARGISFEAGKYTNPTIIKEEIHKERTRELVGEGFRMYDIVRWKKGFERSDSQQNVEGLARPLGVPAVVLSEGKDLKQPADAMMMIWEFPIRDMENNKNLKDNKNWK